MELRRQRMPPRPFIDTFRIFNLELPERNNIIEKFQEEYASRKQEHSPPLEWRNTPQPHHIKFIKTNAKFLNKPICYVDTDDTKDKEGHWWPRSEPLASRPKPPYDKQSTQRNDFQDPSCKLSWPIRYSNVRLPSHGIVPLASPRMPTRLPRIFQEEISFKHHYNARVTPCIPYQGKKQGAFVWREIKPARGIQVPEGTAALTSPQGSDPLEQPQVEKGNCMTSPCLCLPDSQETPDSDPGLSKTDISVEAKADLSASEKRMKSGGISQKDKMDIGYPAGEEPSCPVNVASLHKSQDILPPLPKAEQCPVEIQMS
ncbi:ciliary microtubule inner protein 6 isoform X2 [Paroedura picta]|uniref:ciliary microtubule inner protein 6 isoform X2 n=1 Tax=Paroedura picta TaxID=143630 RepID=UPI004055F461